MKLYILFAVCIINTICYSQNNDINNIKNHYLKISELIANCDNEEECNLYQNKVEVNSNNGSWRAVGNYNKNITFWYNDDPKMTEEYGNKGIEVLQKITIEEWSGVEKFNFELLFKKGKLIFYYLKSSDEYRYYFKESNLIRHVENSEIITIEDSKKSTIEKIKNEAESLQQLFLLSHK